MQSELAAQDRKLLALIREKGQMSVPELCAALGVTSTAVRQRLDRLSAAGSVNRIEVRRGRGRPSFGYGLTAAGMRALGHNQAELARILWEQFLQIEDSELRHRLISGVSRQLAEFSGPQELPGGRSASVTVRAADTAAAAGPEQPANGLRHRLERVAAELRSRNMPVTVLGGHPGELPVMRFSGCPYPDLSGQGHEICELETEMLTHMAGVPMRLAECRCHASDGTCTYVPVLLAEGASPAEAVSA